jgi:hypothetical protein
MPENHLTEEWRPVVGFEGYYSVSSSGRVRSDRSYNNTTWPGRIKNTFIDRGGYPCVSIFKKRNKKSVRVHKLVADAFIGPCPSGLETNHKNGVKLDNHRGNLEYITRSANALHARSLGLGLVGETHPFAKLSANDVLEIRRLSGRGMTSSALGKQFGITRANARLIISRRSWKNL